MRRTTGLLLTAGLGLLALGIQVRQPAVVPARAQAPFSFEVPSVVDPVHTHGEPSLALNPVNGHVFVSGPTGTGTQRSTWFGSLDGGHTYRNISVLPPSAILGTEAPPGGGDTDIAFDRAGKQYYSDLYALTCFRMATTSDDGATVQQQVFPGGCAGQPRADREWFAVYDPPPGLATTSAYTGPKPLIYNTYNQAPVGNGGQWVKSNNGLDYTVAYSGSFGANGYPAIDQVTGKVFVANYSGQSIKMNIGTPDAAGNLTFLDTAPGTSANLVTVAPNVINNSGEAANFMVTTMDSARNLYVGWVARSNTPLERQAYIAAASAASGWRTWTPPTRVSFPPSRVSIFPWAKAGGPGRAAVAWYGSDIVADPSTAAGQKWNVFVSQAVFPVDANGAITGAAPAVTQAQASPHPVKYDDVCLAGTACIAQQGNRNLADFFNMSYDRTGAIEIVYDDTSNGLSQPGFVPPTGGGGVQIADHAGAPVVTVVRQASGPGLLGAGVSGPLNTPSRSLSDVAGDARFPVMGGTNVPGMDIRNSRLDLAGNTLTVSMDVVDLANPATTAQTLQAPFMEYVTRWQMGNDIFYAAMENSAVNQPQFFAGKAMTVDLCSVSACFPHDVLYPEPPLGTTQPGEIKCPATPSAAAPCTVTLRVATSAIGSPTPQSLLEEVGAYALSQTNPEADYVVPGSGNALAQADSVPIEIDGVCCYNFQAAYVPPAAVTTPVAAPSASPSAVPLPNTGGSPGRPAPWPLLLPALLGGLLLLARRSQHRRRGTEIP